jgi:hypothetical protein
MSEQTFRNTFTGALSFIVDFIAFSITYITDKKFLLPMDDEDDDDG